MKAGAAVASFLHGRRGVYTTMRSVGLNSIFSLDEHVRRLALIPQALDPARRHDSFDEEATSRVVVPRLREAMQRFVAERGASVGEMKISAAMRMKDETADAATATLDDMEVLVAVEQLYDLRVRRRFVWSFAFADRTARVGLGRVGVAWSARESDGQARPLDRAAQNSRGKDAARLQ
jgi:hypothetical protein